MSVNDLLEQLVDELADGEVTAALGESFTLGALWADLCRLAGEDLPPLVRLLIGDEAVDEVAAEAHRDGLGAVVATPHPEAGHPHRGDAADRMCLL